MITIRVVCVGNLKERFWIDAENEYKKRLSRFCKFEIVELEEQNKFENIEKIKMVEGEYIISSLAGRNILLDLNGKQFSSEQFAEKIENYSLQTSVITFVIGGSYGVSDKVKSVVNEKISFGKATFPHNLARIILLEQIYRSFMINSNSKYHK